MVNKYPTSKFMIDLGYEPQKTPKTPVPSLQETSYWRWYVLGKFKIALLVMDIHLAHASVDIYISFTNIPNNFNSIRKIFENDRMPELLLVLEAMANPKLMPLCVSINWASALVEFYLKGHDG